MCPSVCCLMSMCCVSVGHQRHHACEYDTFSLLLAVGSACVLVSPEFYVFSDFYVNLFCCPRPGFLCGYMRVPCVPVTNQHLVTRVATKPVTYTPLFPLIILGLQKHYALVIPNGLPTYRNSVSLSEYY
jgi:hypothetical protein